MFWFDIFDENLKEYKGKNKFQYLSLEQTDKKQNKDENIYS
jgi:hypothetical protein